VGFCYLGIHGRGIELAVYNFIHHGKTSLSDVCGAVPQHSTPGSKKGAPHTLT